MDAQTRDATEADFCSTCEETKTVDPANKDTVLLQVLDIVKKIDQKAASSVVNAQDKYRKKNLKKRRALQKQRRCKGKWDEESESFIEYEMEEILDCKISKIKKQDSFERELYYNNTLKDELWELALSDDYDLLNASTLKDIRKFFRNNLSVQNSTNTIHGYLNWRNQYEGEELEGHTKHKLNQILSEAQTLSRIDSNLKTDYQYLTQKYWDISNSSTHTANPVTHSVPHQPNSLKTDVLDLY